MSTDLVSIVIPHYRTKELVKLCLRSLKYYTSLPIEVIVVENNSGDDSVDYLRSVRWIRLIERGSSVSPNGSKAHREAMDVGLAAAKGAYLLSFHTDTIVKDPAWLPYLLKEIRSTENTAAVGSWKLEIASPLKRAGKMITDPLADFVRRVSGRAVIREAKFFRSHCALYRMAALRRHGLRFDPVEETTAGEAIYRGLVENGYDVRWLSELELMRYVDHLNHATGLLTVPHKAVSLKGRKKMKRLVRYFDQPRVRAFLQDSSLDM
jgi:glycosyltransferase involved in cell wall biosynthesis